LYQSLQDASHEAELYFFLGYLHVVHFDNPEKVLELTGKALAIFKVTGQPTRLAACFHNLGVLEMYGGNIDAAEAYLRDSLLIRRQAKMARMMALSLSTLLWIAIYRGQFEQAEAYTQETLYLSKESGNPMDIFSSQGNLMVVRIFQERY